MQAAVSGADGGAVEPKSSCPHLWSAFDFEFPSKLSRRLLFDEPCADCGSVQEEWICLSCCRVSCSRFVNGDAEMHWIGTLERDVPHCMALSRRDLSIWCYACNSYVKHDALQHAFSLASHLKHSSPDEPAAAVAPCTPQQFTAAVVLPAPCTNLHKHPTKPSLLERPVRAQVAAELLDACGLLKRVRCIEAPAATLEQLLRTHSQEHIAAVLSARDSTSQFHEKSDLYACDATPDAALHAAGAVVKLVDMVMQGAVSSGFALVRPPGHHASRAAAEGFCFFNNVAVAAAHAMAAHGLERVMIVDWDIHHGNGTQELFYDSNRVLTVSIHRQTFSDPKIAGGELLSFHESGEARMIGGAAAGFNVNVALGQGEPGVGLSDHDYFHIFNQIVLPLARSFRPQIVLVASGFDACVADCHLPSGGYSVTPQASSWGLGVFCARITDSLLSFLKFTSILTFFSGVWRHDQSAEERERKRANRACARRRVRSARRRRLRC
jgi:acetoin utilization deacetylase AcuC-like enzyme